MTTHRATRTVAGLTFTRRTSGFRPTTVWRAELNGHTVSTFHKGGVVAGRWHPYLREWREAVCNLVENKR